LSRGFSRRFISRRDASPGSAQGGDLIFQVV
jgi:hypothetical protein